MKFSTFWQQLAAPLKSVSKTGLDVLQKAWDTVQLAPHDPYKVPADYIQRMKKNPQQLNVFFTGAMQSFKDGFEKRLKEFSSAPYKMYRHMDYQKALEDIKQYYKEHPKANINIIGHSMGTSAAARLAKVLPKARAFLLDPVHPTHFQAYKDLPKDRVSVYYPDYKGLFLDPRYSWNNLVAWFGNRKQLPTVGKASFWKGDHLNGAEDKLQQILRNLSTKAVKKK